MEQDAVNQREWDSPANWSNWGYASRLDTRLWVPKRFGIGQAINRAHPGAKVFFAGMAIIPLLLLLVVLIAVLTN